MEHNPLPDVSTPTYWTLRADGPDGRDLYATTSDEDGHEMIVVALDFDRALGLLRLAKDRRPELDFRPVLTPLPDVEKVAEGLGFGIVEVTSEVRA